MRLGQTMPNFKAQTTKGPINFHDWQGNSWVVLFSHPSDFTPVCTTELGRIAVHQPEFAKRNTKCLAHSVDPLDSHVDWVNDIKSYCLDIPGEFPYPIIADPTRDLAVSLGMLDEDQKKDPEVGKTIRALFIISPDHKVRLTMFYPMSMGRNVDEILRCIDSLQLTDRLKVVATPANWTPGTKVMILPSVSDADAHKLFPKGFDKVSMPSGVNYVRTTENY
ncbi:peroxiredoxin-6 [Drosophila grimshawi]|uniref:1-Cys peroxiredoxin n=1 Tax=Drosophila grimshawi TaxID=7222 RepID=B4J6Y2_DROGR|nr:peroxiredoxin-6 [Drosophila grimshawi]XP_001987198.1 peroxiredoxin-6 [Drosophila grimshawi]EDW02063.1 GH20104 [Drosophila grimshawi]EDW02065.1 GH20103 [Drosophila grimshawi]